MPMWLVVRGNPPYQLEQGKDVTLGRGRDCDMSLYSSLLSREHARVRWEGEQPVLFDLESLNGCFIGPDRISRHALHDGDVIRLGDLMIQFRVCERPPVPPEDEPQAPAEVPPEPEPPVPSGDETRLFSRTVALHQRLFDFDELGQLCDEVEHHVAWVRHPLLGAPDLVGWFSALTAAARGPRAEGILWHLLRIGVVAPRDHARELSGRRPHEVAGACALTKRGERLRELLDGKRIHWNEIAALRYRLRQGRLFQPLRHVARAYRPGGGLEELTVARLVYELEEIYAADLKGRALALELRRLLCMGLLAPGRRAGAAAWYPRDWGDGSVEIAPRGRALLNGFRLED